MATGIFAMVDGTKQFLWTVESHVGPGCPNHVDDVELAQMAFHACSKLPVSFIPASLRAICARIQPGSPYRGQADDPLTMAIVDYQANVDQRVRDDRLSPIARTAMEDGLASRWMMGNLVVVLRTWTAQTWPLLHRAPGCPRNLAERSKAMFQTYR